MNRVSIFLFFSILIPVVASAQPATISGTVTAADESPAANAQVTLVQLNRSMRTQPDGGYQFDNVPAGSYLVMVESARYGSAVRQVDVAAGDSAILNIELDLAVHREQIVVTASPEARAAEETYQPTEVLSQEELALRIEPTLGETLSKSPGVSSTSFAPGASRPVIRGLGGDRLRVLEEGVGTGDASNVSPDHAVSYDPISAEQIEIVRGPATLLYGSNALGGVVNVIDSRIPRTNPNVPVTGVIDLGFGTVADERKGAVRVKGSLNSFVWNADYHRRETDNYEIPGPAVEGHEGEEPQEEELTGELLNSALESEGATLGGAWIGDRGLIGLAVTTFDSFYGVPVHLHEEEEAGPEEEEHDEDVKIDLEQRRFDLRAELLNPTSLFRSLKLRLGLADYKHQELEGDEVGTLFENDSWEARIEAPHNAIGRWTGAIGAQISSSDFSAIGDEAFVPPSITDTRALFIFEEIIGDPFDFQFGLRWEQQDIEARDMSRDFSGVSGSAGAIWHIDPQWILAASVSRAVRAPTAAELFSDGPHLATFTFELGNPDLEEEVSLGTDLSLKKTEGRVTAELNLFWNQFDGYIFESPTGAFEGELPVFRFEQEDARFIGFEAHSDIELWHREPDHLDLEISADWVDAELDSGIALPRIPPLRLGAGLRYRSPRIWALAEVRHVFEQDEIAPFEEPTDEYTMLNAALGYRLFLGNTIHDFVLRGTNLTDELARNHVSPLKEFVPLPGRDLSLSYRLTF